MLSWPKWLLSSDPKCERAGSGNHECRGSFATQAPANATQHARTHRAVLIIGVWLGTLARMARVQYDAVATTKNTHGQVVYEWDVTDGHITLRGKPWAPTWLVDLIGIDYFGHVTQVHLTYTASIEVAMAPIGRLVRLRVLNLRKTPLNDADLASFKGLSSLAYLDLQSTQVTDAGLVHLKGLNSLRVLSLRDTRVSDAGLVHLTGLTSLKL